MKFEDIEKYYKRIDIISEANLINFYSTRLARTKSFDEKNTIIRAVDIIKRRYDNFYEYVFIRHTQDSSNNFFSEEFKYFEANEDEFKKACVKFALTLLDDDDLDKLKKRWGKYFFDKLEIMQNLYSKDVIGLNINENKILKEIIDYRDSQEIYCDDEKITNKNLAKYISLPDREKRKKLMIAMNNNNTQNKEYYAEKYRDLVVIRHKIAKRLGFDGYLDFSDKDRCRIDYDHNDIIGFRNAIKKYLASNAHTISDIQKDKLGIDALYTYDLRVYFKDYNPMPLKDPYLLLKTIAKNLERYNPYLSKIINKIFDENSLDLEPRANKVNMTYASYLHNYDISYIFTNYKGSDKDFSNFITCLSYTLINYVSSYNELIEYTSPQDDIVRAYSTAFAFIILSFADELFTKDAKKYALAYKIKVLYDILFYCLINEFEESLYLDIKTDVDERYEIFRQLHSEYFPFLKIEQDVFDVGMWWLNYHTLFNTPMLSINYALGALSGLDYYNNFTDDRENALKKMTTLMENASKEDFLKSIELSGLKNPFIEENIKDIVIKYIDNLASEYKKI